MLYVVSPGQVSVILTQLPQKAIQSDIIGEVLLRFGTQLRLEVLLTVLLTKERHLVAAHYCGRSENVTRRNRDGRPINPFAFLCRRKARRNFVSCQRRWFRSHRGS